MKLVVYGPDRRLGAIDADRVIDLNFAYAKYLRERQDEPLPYEMASAVVPAELGAFIESGERAIEGALRALEHVKASDLRGLRGERLTEALGDVKLHAPYARRARIMMAGGNYVVHSQGMSDRGATLKELFDQARKRGIWGFYCFPENAAGPDEEIVYPARTDRLDYEGEVAVIIGRRGKDIAADRAEPYFWGYMLQNDVSARSNVGGPDNPTSSFSRGKNFDTSITGGPYIAVGEFTSAQNIDWETRVNGSVRQTGNTRDMTFSFAEYLEYISQDMTILPGDVISAGTTAGTAQDSSPLMAGETARRAPDLFLKPGDVVEISNPVMGTLRNRVVAK